MDAQTTSPAFLTIRQSGRRIGCSTRTVYNFISEGVIPATRIRGRLRVPATALEVWIAEREREALEAVRDP